MRLYRLYPTVAPGATTAETLAARVREADFAIRGAYVLHGPNDFRIVVDHRDEHRGPGVVKLTVGDVVRLVAQSTEHWIPVRVTRLPATPTGYHAGVIIQQLVAASVYQVGNSVQFSEDQVVTETQRASSRGPRGPKRRYYV